MKKITLLFIPLLLSLISNAQMNTCSIKPLSSDEYKYLKSIAVNSSLRKASTGGLRNVSLNINILLDNGQPTTTLDKIQVQIDTVNNLFANAGIEFGICNVNYFTVPANTFSWDPFIESSIASQYDLPGCINIYYVNYIANASAYAYYPGAYSPDRIAMSRNLSGEILAHELGHSFFLIHTHGDAASPYGTEELVNGSNCTTTADLICDTPADPNLFYNTRVDTLCNYTDTVSTDSLGFLFTPDTRNIMSYTRFSCYEHFTQGQYDRIAYVMANQRAYLKSGVKGAATITAPLTVCLTDAPVVLSVTPAGGIFSGNGVSGNVFDPSQAGGGYHIINYTAPGLPSNPESTDQYYSYNDTIYSSASVWQSFLTSMSENINGVSLYIKSAFSQSIVATLYDSIGLGGVVLQQDTIQVNSDSIASWIRFNFSSPVHLDAGKDYTIQITAINPIEFYGNRYNVYLPGQSSTVNDLSFITHVLTDVPFCGNTSSAVIYVSSPPEPIITNLLPVYCKNAPALPIQANPSGGIASVDGSVSGIIDPSVIGPGLHSLHYTYTNNYGCSNDSTFLFQVNDTTSISPVIPSIICESDSVLVLTGNPAGGVFYFDNQPLLQPQIDLNTLTYGSHNISYVYDATYPWVDTVDQDNYFNLSNFSYAISFGQTAWQSFTAGQDGYLNLVEFGLYIGDTTNCTYRLYSGSDTSGVMLFSDTIEITNSGTYEQQFAFPAFQHFLKKDSLYTFEILINPIVTNATLYNDSVYAGGVAGFAQFGLSEADFKFRTHINSVYQCGEDSVSNDFIYINAPSVSLGNDTILTSGQSLVLDAGNPGSTYLWSTGETAQQINISISAGTSIYIVTVTNADGCSVSDSINVMFITGIEERDDEFSFAPNPVDDIVVIKAMKSISEVSVYNALGQSVLNILYSDYNSTRQINLVSLTSGVYTIQVVADNYRMLKRLVVKD